MSDGNSSGEGTSGSSTSFPRPVLTRSRTSTNEGAATSGSRRQHPVVRSVSHHSSFLRDNGDDGRFSNQATRNFWSQHPRQGTNKSRIQKVFELARSSTLNPVPNFSPGSDLRTSRLVNVQLSPMPDRQYHIDGDQSNVTRMMGGASSSANTPYNSYGGINNNADGASPYPSTPRSGISGQHRILGTESRTFYDDFTTIDWPRDVVKDSSRRKALQLIGGISGKLTRMNDAIQGWMLITIIGFSFALIVYAVAQVESLLSDLRHGICATGWLKSEHRCCPYSESFGMCSNWKSWSEVLKKMNDDKNKQKTFFALNFTIYSIFSLTFAYLAVLITLKTKTVNPLFEEASEKQKRQKEKRKNYNKPASSDEEEEAESSDTSDSGGPLETDTMLAKKGPQRVFYTGYGSGVPEVKTIVSGFVIRKFLGTTTLLYKTIGLIFSVSSGMSLGKEGPFVHLATCVGNITCRLSKKFSQNDMKRRQLLSSAASAGVALAFGSPLGGILFSLEEVSYYFLPQQLFRMFFCAMISALFLKFLDPYGTGRIVIFSVTYPDNDWKPWELFCFIFIGIVGGIYGALFCKFHVWWSKTFRQLKWIKNSSTFEVMLVAIITVILTFPNELTSKGVNELLLDLARPCTDVDRDDMGLCPTTPAKIPGIIGYLSYALIVKIILTAITFGLKVPAGIYIPSMVVGALFGRIFGLSVQYLDHIYTHSNADLANFVVPGVYAMAAAGSFMAGVTRMNVTLAVILFELTGSLDHVLPFSIGILVANWVANAIEPNSIYEIIIHKNDFPFLPNRIPKAFDSRLSDLVTVLPRSEIIDVQNSIYISTTQLRQMLLTLQHRGEFDGCIPIVKGKVLMGLISAPELEYALDFIQQRCEELEYYEPVMCKLPVREADMKKYHLHYSGLDRHQYDEEQSMMYDRDLVAGHDTSDYFGYPVRYEDEEEPQDDEIQRELCRIADLTPYIDRVPITMDIHSPLSLVQMMFTQVGTRIICVIREGKFVGLLHKKKFINFTHNDNR